MEEFHIINGRCSVTDDTLVIDRSDVREMGRLDVFRLGVSTYLDIVHFQREGSDAATHLGFREFMTDEITTAHTAFERHSIPSRDADQLASAADETSLPPLKE